MAIMPNRLRLLAMVSALALAAALLALALGAKPAQAQAETVTDTHRSQETFLAVSCTGEEVLFQGTLHVVSHTTIDANGGFHSEFQVNLKGQGEGLESGAEYVFHQVFTQHVNSPSGAAVNETFTETFKVIRQGSDTPADDLQAKALFHVTINAQGEVTAEVSKFEFVCK